MQQELNDTKSLLLKYQIDLQSSLDCKVKNIKNVFSFRRVDKSDKDVNFSTCLNNTKVFLWILKKLEKHITITHKIFSLPYHVLVVLMKIKLALLRQDIDDRFNVNAAKISQIWRNFYPVIAKCLKNFLHGQTGEQLYGHFQNVLKRSFVTAFAL